MSDRMDQGETQKRSLDAIESRSPENWWLEGRRAGMQIPAG
jgi:hypothetical protein